MNLPAADLAAARPTAAPDLGAFAFDNSYVRELAGAWVACRPVPVAAPRLLYLDDALAAELGLDAAALRGPGGAALLAGNALPAGAEPIAQAYAGHQFGGFSPQLGDGRALLLGELVDRDGMRQDLALKGSGRTPFSRGGDGRAAVGPMLREAVVGTAMHALGIPTTRALAVVATGEAVLRETALPGALLARVASSHLRVGTFQYFAARGDRALLERLVAYALRRHPGDAAADAGDDASPALALLRGTARRQAHLIARWMNVGFIHGVMNTDNMTVSGETIDYGPCAFVEAYDPAAVFSSIDRQGRYAFGNQPAVARWNLARLAEALLPLLHDDEATALAAAHAVLDTFALQYRRALRDGQRAKLGLAAPGVGPADRRADGVADGSPGATSSAAAIDTARRRADAAAPAAAARDIDDDALAEAWLALLQCAGADFTLAHAALTTAADAPAGGAADTLLRTRLQAAGDAEVDDWLRHWRDRRAVDGTAAAPATGAAMRRANPLLIARNHRVEEVLDAASSRDDLAPLHRLLALLRRPFDATPDEAAWLAPAAPEVTAAYRTFCGT